MLNRGISPNIKSITQLNLPLPQQLTLDNGIPISVISLGTQAIFKIEVVFNAGRPFEHKKMIARATASLLKEGSRQKTASAIAEQLDFYGSSLSIPVNLDTSNFVLYGLTKHFDKMIGLLTELLMEPIFPEQELKNYVQNSKQRLKVDLAQTDVVSYRKITELIYGEEHPYGYNSRWESYDHILRTDLIQHWDKNYLANNCQIILSGKISPDMIKQVNRHLGLLPTGPQPNAHFPPIHNTVPQKIKLEQKGAVQASIRIGRQLFNKKHPDFKGLLFLNTVLGGYFGSRLMTNIREDKGYTYNIYSTIDSLHTDGYFYIGAEVGTDVAESALKEIYLELDRLIDEPVKDEELKMVKNYMLGNLLAMLDGTFNIADVIKTIVTEQLSFEDFDELVDSTNNMNAQKLQQLARQYFQKDKMWEVVVGA